MCYSHVFARARTLVTRPWAHEATEEVWVWASHPLLKQCAAVATQQGEMSEPPHRKPSRCRKIAASHGCVSIGVKEPPTILFALRSDVSPQVSSARTQNGRRRFTADWKFQELRQKLWKEQQNPPVSSTCGLSDTVGPEQRQRARSFKRILYPFTVDVFLQPYILEYHIIPSRSCVLCGHGTMALGCGRGSCGF